MPKLTRPAHEVDEVKQNILLSALSLMCEDGFDALSMRKLAKRLGMTAANIYNYYKNKDELYLVIQTKGFRMLVDRFTGIASSGKPPVDKIRDMMQSYIDFGIKNPDYYEIMFSRNTPKYADYKNTPMEDTAFVEKKTALEVADLACRTILAMDINGKKIGHDEAFYMTVSAWATLHGIVNLYNSRVLQEVADKADEFIDNVITDIINRFT